MCAYVIQYTYILYHNIIDIYIGIHRLIQRYMLVILLVIIPSHPASHQLAAAAMLLHAVARRQILIALDIQQDRPTSTPALSDSRTPKGP